MNIDREHSDRPVPLIAGVAFLWCERIEFNEPTGLGRFNQGMWATQRPRRSRASTKMAALISDAVAPDVADTIR
jgi:hypothetical protein